MAHRKDQRLPASARGKISAKQKRLNRAPEGEPFIWLTRSFLESVAYRSLSGSALQCLARIMIEQMAHSGTENGNLTSTYDQIAEHGVRRPSIAEAIRELAFYGFIRVKKGFAYRGEHTPSKYRLTWLPLPDGSPATNEWKAITTDHAKAWKFEKRQKNKAKKCFRDAKANLKVGTASNVVPMVKAGGNRNG